MLKQSLPDEGRAMTNAVMIFFTVLSASRRRTLYVAVRYFTASQAKQRRKRKSFTADENKL
jgi:DNA/RNA endonuclease G (NUC1)